MFSFFFAHTEREKKRKSGITTYYLCTLGTLRDMTYNNKIKVTKMLVFVDPLTFEPLNFFFLIDLFYFDFIILSTRVFS